MQRVLVSTYPRLDCRMLGWMYLLVVIRRRHTIWRENGSFCLLKGHGGDAWVEATKKISKVTDIPPKSYGIGSGLAYDDAYGGTDGIGTGMKGERSKKKVCAREI